VPTNVNASRWPGTIAVPLAPVTSGFSRSFVDNLSRRSGHIEARIVQIPKLIVHTQNMAHHPVTESGPDCWLHPDLEVRPSPIAQLGLFAKVPILPGTVVSRLGGRLVTGDELSRILLAAGQSYVDSITVDEDQHLVLPADQLNHYGNHSCDPNLWWADAYTLAVRRRIAAGEEVTNDYGTSTGIADFSMTCVCRSPQCRGTITGQDWRRAELQARYGDHWVPVLLDRIRRSH
jgi:uncharacterized protein